MDLLSDWISKKLKRRMLLSMDRYASDIPADVRERFVNISLKIFSFITKVGIFMFLLYFFSVMILNRLGFEKTLIVLLTLLLLSMKKVF